MNRLGLVLAALLLGACTKASDSAEAKRMPKPPPSASAGEAEGTLHVTVDVDGAPEPAIDAQKLAATPPDYKDDEHRAWRLSTLLGPKAARPNAVVTVKGGKDVAVTMKNPASPADPLPVLSINRRGEAMVSLVPADQPFPSYHGQGGRLSRPGDPLPRIVGVTEIHITSPK